MSNGSVMRRDVYRGIVSLYYESQYIEPQNNVKGFDTVRGGKGIGGGYRIR